MFKFIVSKLIDMLSDNDDIKAIKAKAKSDKLAKKYELQNAKVEEKIQEHKNLSDLDAISLKNMKNSYKDELLLAIFIAPIVLSFIPSTQEYIAQGFKALETLPMWYQGIVIGMVVTIYGMRSILDKFLNRSKK